MPLRVSASSSMTNSYPLTFADIKGRPGAYQTPSGNVLVIYGSGNANKVGIPHPTRSGRTTGLGQFVYDPATGALRLSESKSGGTKTRYRAYTGSINLTF